MSIRRKEFGGRGLNHMVRTMEDFLRENGSADGTVLRYYCGVRKGLGCLCAHTVPNAMCLIYHVHYIVQYNIELLKPS